MLTRAVAAALLALALGGCAGPPASPQPPAGPVAAPQHLQLSGCTAWQALSLPAPVAVAPGHAPAGWEPDAAAASAVLMAGFRCDRLSLGAFERGPIRLLLDTHDRAQVPAACTAQAPSGMQPLVLESLWVDDAEVAAFLNATYGMPARVARLEEQSQAAAGATLHTWAWGAPGQAASTLTVLDDGTRQPFSVAHELLWPRGAGIGALELAFLTEWPGLPRSAHGTLQPPMLAQGAFAGSGEWLTEASPQGTFRLYRDPLCAQPEA